MKNFRRTLLLLAFFVVVLPTFAQLKLPAIFSDYMVLQQNSQAPVWGWAAPGTTVSLTTGWGNVNYEATANNEGRWILKVDVPAAGSESFITVSSGEEKLTLNHVMAGEVWLCSGQSNMEMPVEGWVNQPITESEKYIAEGNYPNIRLFTVQRKTAYEPQDDCIGTWAPATPETVAKFSATGYFFGLKLYQELGIPVGLIHSSWGGTPAEAWTSGEFIKNIPEIAGRADFDAAAYREQKLKNFAKEQMQWVKDMGFVSPDGTPDWTTMDFDDSGWATIPVPATWNETAAGAYTGVMELRYEFTVPGSWRKKATILELGPIDEMDITWVNGIEVGKHLDIYDWATARSYEIPAGVLKKGRNVVSVMVANTSGIGGINGKPEQVKIYPKGKNVIWQPLAGDWKFRKARAFDRVVSMPSCINCAEPQTPTTLYNGMIAPIVPYRIAGAIWYQGESNRSDGALYSKIFPNMIKNWRHDWNQGMFPFYFVQIAPYSYSDNFSTGALKEAQTLSMAVPNTGMVVTGDVGSLRTIHPPDKKSVGFRLANWALAKDYGFADLAYCGPIYKAWKKEGDKIRIYFDYADQGLVAKDGPLTHFLIAGADRKFVEARAEVDGNTVLVYADQLKDPVAVRFSWGHTDEPNLFNSEGLPASPFRTDAWKVN